jgi:Endonuclease domain
MTSSNKRCPNNEKLIIVEPIPINCGWQNLTVNHAKYFAHELTKRCASDSVEQLASTMARRFVREAKGTKDFLKLRTSETDKVRCGHHHFEAIGVPFAVVVTTEEI